MSIGIANWGPLVIPEDVDELLDRELPAVVVTTAKTRKTVGGVSHVYTVDWDVTVMSILRGPSRQQTKKLAGLMEGCVRRCMVQKARQNAGILAGCHWIETEVAPVRDATGNGRYLAAGIGKYNVATDAAAQGFGGPDVPDATSYAPLAVVTDVVIDVESED